MLAEDIAIVLIKDTQNPLNLLEFFSSVRYFLNEIQEVGSVFGLFQDEYLKFFRKKVRKEYYSSFNYNKLILLFEITDTEAYYTYFQHYKEFLGIEIRYNTP